MHMHLLHQCLSFISSSLPRDTYTHSFFSISHSLLCTYCRFGELTFIASQAGTVHGFTGTFEAVLYDDVMLSIVPKVRRKECTIHMDIYAHIHTSYMHTCVCPVKNIGLGSICELLPILIGFFYVLFLLFISHRIGLHCILLHCIIKSFSKGMFSWFPLFIPLASPVRVEAGQPLSACFWRYVHVCMYACMHLCMFVCLCIYMDLCTYECMNVLKFS
jgi:hypothetical protein